MEISKLEGVSKIDLNSLCHSSDVMVGMGFSGEKIEESLSKMNYDEITAIYLLLGRKTNEVSC